MPKGERFEALLVSLAVRCLGTRDSTLIIRKPEKQRCCALSNRLRIAHTEERALHALPKLLLRRAWLIRQRSKGWRQKRLQPNEKGAID